MCGGEDLSYIKPGFSLFDGDRKLVIVWVNPFKNTVGLVEERIMDLWRKGEEL